MRVLPHLRAAHASASVFLVLCAGRAEERTPLRFHDVPMDGDCLFSAVALSASLTDGQPAQSAAALRAEAMDLLCPNGAPDPELSIGGLPASLLIEPLGGEGEAGYCERMRKAGEWGSTAELLALTRVLKRAIRVHTSFGIDEYGAEEHVDGDKAALAVHFEGSHYRAVTECAASIPGSAVAEGADEHAIAKVLDALHAAAAAADAQSYFACFAAEAVFLSTDASERWPIAEFESYARARFAAGDGWSYAVRQRHITVRGGVAWFDETLHNAKLGACRGSGVLVRATEEAPWLVAQYNLMMAVANEHALQVAALARSTPSDER